METLVRVTLTLAFVFVIEFLRRFIRARLTFYQLKKQGMPMPSWNPVLGHLQKLDESLKQLPKGCQATEIFSLMSHDFPGTSRCFYADCWPFGNPLLVINSPDLAIQACQEHDLPKPSILIPFFRPFAGDDRNLFVVNGKEWRHSRSLFNPGFSAAAMLEHMPHIITEAEAYVEKLQQHAQNGDTFSLDEITYDYMTDVIGVVTLNARLKLQNGYNELASAMRSSLRWHCLPEEPNLFVRWNPIRPLVHAYNGYKMNRYISTELDKRYEEWKSGKVTGRAKSVMDIVIADYMSSSQGKTAKKSLDAEFKHWAITEIRLFLFAGHDSTAATIAYSCYLLSKHPEKLTKLREEHTKVFGADLSAATGILKEYPQKINALPYTTAIIKEVLRLFPPASGIREGLPNVYLHDKYGNRFPTEHLNVWVNHSALHRNPEYWPEPHSFIPERWLAQPEDPLYPPKGGWRPFEYGPRNCVGQTLAMLDIKITLVMTARRFDFKDQYTELDRSRPPKDVSTVYGERAYQISQGAAHPADGLPCQVTLRGD